LRKRKAFNEVAHGIAALSDTDVIDVVLEAFISIALLSHCIVEVISS